MHAVLRVQKLVGQASVDGTFHKAPGVVPARPAFPGLGEGPQLVVVPYKRKVFRSQRKKDEDRGLEDAPRFIHYDGVDGYLGLIYLGGNLERLDSLCDVAPEAAEGALRTVDRGDEHHRRRQHAEACEEF